MLINVVPIARMRKAVECRAFGLWNMEYGIATDGMERVRRLLEIEWSELTAHTQLLEPSRWRRANLCRSANRSSRVCIMALRQSSISVTRGDLKPVASRRQRVCGAGSFLEQWQLHSGSAVEWLEAASKWMYAELLAVAL